MKSVITVFQRTSTCALLLAAACISQAVEQGAWIELIDANGLSQFREPHGDWQIVGDAQIDRYRQRESAPHTGGQRHPQQWYSRKDKEPTDSD